MSAPLVKIVILSFPFLVPVTLVHTTTGTIHASNRTNKRARHSDDQMSAGRQNRPGPGGAKPATLRN